ncbi:hypothetical protein CTAYLR_009904 [Chrysophaeum taylorii]|uniref:CS domain-containing protein n=1 Tax=Chrysophaeum taylorii TaxID=2483200 RepID=A0AAD7UIG4_9STRA|nr:hypothetical protein CTAYLR_009904 [Chrysophaeum taylorii]
MAARTRKKPVIRHDRPRGKVIGMRADGRLVREGESVEGEWRPLRTRSEPRHHKSPPPPPPPSSSFATMLAEADKAAYGCGREGGGPDPSTEASATTAQLINRAAYYRRLIDEDRDELLTLVEVPKVLPALDVAVRHLARRDIAASRIAYAALAAPAAPIWAKRREARAALGAGVPEVMPRRLDGPAGAAWLDADGLVDDWVAYADVDALPPREALYSSRRRVAKWRSPDAPPPLSALRVLRLLGTRPPSRLPDDDDASTRGGAALDDYGYRWGQSLSELWVRLPLPPGATKAHVDCLLKPRRLHLAVHLDTRLLASPVGRALGASPHTLAILDAPLFDRVDLAASGWFIEEARTPRPGPLGDVLHPAIVLTLAKSSRRWWTRLCDGHPAIRPRDFPFMVDYGNEADEIT